MDLARQVAQRIADLEQDIALKEPQIGDMRAAEDQLHTAITATDRRIETLRREVEVVKVNESVQKAQASVAARGAGAGSSLGSAADSLARIKERQMPSAASASRRPANWKTAARAPIWTKSCAWPASVRASPRPTTSWRAWPRRPPPRCRSSRSRAKPRANAPT
jgi:transcription elongation factor